MSDCQLSSPLVVKTVLMLGVVVFEWVKSASVGFAGYARNGERMKFGPTNCRATRDRLCKRRSKPTLPQLDP